MLTDCTTLNPSTITPEEYLALPEPEVTIDELPPRVADDKYAGFLRYHETRIDFGTPKLYLHFVVMKNGVSIGNFYKVYPVKQLLSPPGINGSYRIGGESNAAKDLIRLRRSFGLRTQNLRNDRPSFRFLCGAKLCLTLTTVHRDHKGEPRPDHRKYSKVEHIEIRSPS